MTFKTILRQAADMNATGFVIPPDIIEALGGGKRAPVRITINGYTYRSTVAVMGGSYMVGVAAEHREKAKVKGGDEIEVTIEFDDAPRTVEVPADFAAALTQAKVRDVFDALAYSHRKEHVRAIEEAKAPETRSRRIRKAIEKLLGAT